MKDVYCKADLVNQKPKTKSYRLTCRMFNKLTLKS